MTLLQALLNSKGTMAQFDHRELGGAGQWMPGGMTMVGDMFNHGLKAKVDGLCSGVTNLGYATLRAIPRELSVTVTEAGWRPAGGRPRRLRYRFGQPIRTRDTRPSVGSMVASGTRVPQRDWRAEPSPLCLFQPKTSISSRAEWTRDRLRHARSRDQRRLSAAGGGGSLTLTSQHGTVSVSTLPVVSVDGVQTKAPEPRVAPASEPYRPDSAQETDLFAKIERLAELHKKGILSSEEFAAKKAELLSRL